MLDLSQPHPLTAIVDSVSAKTPIGSVMRTAEWQTMPAGLRDAAFFSASVESTRWLQLAQDGIADVIGRARATNERGESYWKMDRARLLADLRQYGEKIALQRPGGRDGKIREADIADPLSIARLRLIIETQMEMAYGKADWLTSMDPDILAAFPAWELVRISPRRVPRDWPARWKGAGGKISEGGRLIALKNSPIWKTISRFANPYPPFDFNSGMGVEDIDREEAEDLGLLKAGDVLTPNVREHQESLEASLKGIQAAQVEQLKKLLSTRLPAVKVDAAKQVISASPRLPVSKSPVSKSSAKESKQRAELTAQTQAFSAEFGVDVVFQTPRRFGAKMTLTAAAQHLQTIGTEWSRMREAYPDMPKSVKTFACVASPRGRSHVDGPAPMLSTKAASNLWEPEVWARRQLWEQESGRPMGTERPGTQIEDNFRHELAHAMSTPDVMDEFKRVVLTGGRDLNWVGQNVSHYGSTDPRESLAEIFALCTRPDYVRGTLPAEVEDFVFAYMLKVKPAG